MFLFTLFMFFYLILTIFFDYYQVRFTYFVVLMYILKYVYFCLSCIRSQSVTCVYYVQRLSIFSRSQWKNTLRSKEDTNNVLLAWKQSLNFQILSILLQNSKNKCGFGVWQIAVVSQFKRYFFLFTTSYSMK